MSISAISDVGKTIVKLLREKITNLAENTEETGGESQNKQISLLSPAEAKEQDIRLTFFLYSVSENPDLKNQGLQPINVKTSAYPPLVLDLKYLLTAHRAGDAEQNVLDSYTILGEAMQVLHDNSILSGSALQGSLAGKDNELRISVNPLSTEEIHQIWSIFPEKAYRTSVSYTVTPVCIDSARTREEKRVLEKQQDLYQMVSK